MGTDFANPENRPKQKRTEDRTPQTYTGSQDAPKLTPVKAVQKHTPPAERQKVLDELAQRVTDWRKPTRISDFTEPVVTKLGTAENETPAQPNHATNFGSKGEGTLIASNVLPQNLAISELNHQQNFNTADYEAGERLPEAELIARSSPNVPKLKSNIPSGVFIDASGGALTGEKGGQTGLQNRVKGFSQSGANTFYVPILTSDGKVGLNTTDNNAEKIHRDRKYESQVPSKHFGNIGIKNTIWRDVVDETKDAVNASGRHVGRGATDAKVVPWVESGFTTYVGRNGSGDQYLKDLGQTSGFTKAMQNAILTTEVTNPKTGKKEQVPIEFMNEANGTQAENDPKRKGSKTGVGYLDPLDPAVQKNLREVIGKAASKDYVSAIMVDDHFGIPLDKPEVRNAVLTRHPVDKGYLDQLDAQGIKMNDKNKSLIENMWLRSRFTKFVNNVKADLKAKQVQLWASTNLPDTAKAAQGQDIEQWIRTGLVDNWNVQIYRNEQPKFESEYDKLQAQAKRIPQVDKGQVPLSVAISSYANGKQLTTEQMSQQVQYVKDKGNKSSNIQTAPVAFGDRQWLDRAQSQK